MIGFDMKRILELSGVPSEKEQVSENLEEADAYISSEFRKLPKNDEYYSLQVRGYSGGSTKWLNLSKDVISELKKLLKSQKLKEDKDLEEWGGGRRAYPRDPFWIKAKYPGKDINGKPFKKGDRVFYYPNTKTFLTGADAEKASREFEAAKADEYNMTRGMY